MHLSGVGLGFICLVAIVVLVALGFSFRNCIYDVIEQRKVHAEMMRHHNALLQQLREEQSQWRSSRLQDVVLLLIQRGEVVEGIPLAAQIPGRREVLCRRKLRHLEHNTLTALQLEILQEEEAAWPEEIRQTIHMTLDELLAHGRPPEAEAGPDIMQLLLDGQEPHELSSNNGDSESENDENNSEYWVDETQQNTHVPSLATSPLESQPPNELSESPPHHHHQHPLSADNNIINNTQRVAAMNDDHNEQQSQEEQHHEDSNNENDTNNTTTVMTEAEARHARWVEERQAAILRELHAEQARRNRRRRTSEEVYGVGVPYLVNPLAMAENVDADANGVQEDGEEEPQSPIMRFLSPMSPFRNRNKHKANSTYNFAAREFLTSAFVESSHNDEEPNNQEMNDIIVAAVNTPHSAALPVASTIRNN